MVVIRKLLACFLLQCPFHLMATVKHEIDTCKALSCSFSIKQHNRIIVDEGSVKKLICPEGFFSFRLDEDSGQAFVFAQKPCNESILVSVITDQGQVQDLAITLKNKPSEVVVLFNPKEKEEEIIEFEGEDDQAVSMLTRLMEGNVPDGYVPREVKKSDNRVYKRCKLKSQIAVEGAYEIIYAYELKNLVDYEIQLREEDLSQPNDLWVYIESSKIAAKGSTRVVISRRKV